jgi:dephospho-CoA kinase
MKLVALTGSIGMGKSTTLAMFAALGVPVWDADAAVHRIYAKGGVGVEAVGAVFPDCIAPDGHVDREALSKVVLGDRAKLKALEDIVHPLVGGDRTAFINDAQAKGAPMVLLDIPLLFETGGQERVDAVVVVSCAPDLQRTRVLARPGMSVEKFEAIVARQTPDARKREKADFVITTDLGLDETRKQVDTIFKALMTPSAKQQEIF